MKTKRVYLLLNHNRVTVKIFSNLKWMLAYVSSLPALGLQEDFKYNQVYSIIRKSGVFGFDLGGSDAQIVVSELIMAPMLYSGSEVAKEVGHSGSEVAKEVGHSGAAAAQEVGHSGAAAAQELGSSLWGSDVEFIDWKGDDMDGGVLISKQGVRGYFSKQAGQFVYYDGGSLIGYSKTREGIRKKVTARATRKLIEAGKVG